MRMLKTKVRPIATGARWAARPATAVLSATETASFDVSGDGAALRAPPKSQVRS
jgi:hypothetical protein